MNMSESKLCQLTVWSLLLHAALCNLFVSIVWQEERPNMAAEVDELSVAVMEPARSAHHTQPTAKWLLSIV